MENIVKDIKKRNEELLLISSKKKSPIYASYLQKRQERNIAFLKQIKKEKNVKL